MGIRISRNIEKQSNQQLRIEHAAEEPSEGNVATTLSIRLGSLREQTANTAHLVMALPPPLGSRDQILCTPERILHRFFSIET